LAEKKATIGAEVLDAYLCLRGVDCRELLSPQLIEGDRHLLDLGAKSLDQAVAIEGQEYRVGQRVDARHKAVTLPGGLAG